MKASHYLKSLLPSFGKTEILEDLRLTRGEIKDVTQPAYETADKFLRAWKFKSEPMQDKFATFGRLVKVSGGMNSISHIHASMRHVLENMDDVEELVNKTFNEDVAGAGLTYLKASLLQFTECCAFFSKYARKFLIYVYVCETAQYEDSGVQIAESLTPAEVEWLNANFINFCTVVNICSGAPAVVRRQLADIPEISITAENEDTLSASVGSTKIDPFQMKLIPIWLNPVYHVGMWLAEWQANRFKAAKEELKLLELRKMNLEKLAEGKKDASLQKQIEYMEGRVQSLNYKIQKMERDNA